MQSKVDKAGTALGSLIGGLLFIAHAFEKL